MSGVQPEGMAEQQVEFHDVFATIPGDLWKKISEVAGREGVDFKVTAGRLLAKAMEIESPVDSLGRINKKFGRMGEDDTHIVLGHKEGKAWKSMVHGVFSDRAIAELFQDSLYQNDIASGKEGAEYWIVSMPLNMGQLQWWSVSYMFGHGHQGYSVIQINRGQPNNPYELEWFEEGLSVCVVAENENEALERGRRFIKSKL